MDRIASEHWVSVSEAARILGVRERTIERRVAAGKLDHRKAHGRVQVHVPVTSNGRSEQGHDTEAPAEAVGQRAEPAAEATAPIGAVACGSTGGVGQVRRHTTVAWAVAIALGVAVFGAVWMVAAQRGGTKLALQEVRHLRQQVDDLSARLVNALARTDQLHRWGQEAALVGTERDRLRLDLQIARDALNALTTELEALRVEQARKPQVNGRAEAQPTGLAVAR